MPSTERSRYCFAEFAIFVFAGCIFILFSFAHIDTASMSGLKPHLYYRKKCGPDPLKSGQDQFFLTVYMGNDQARLMIERTPGPRNLYTVYTADSCCLDQIFI